MIMASEQLKEPDRKRAKARLRSPYPYFGGKSAIARMVWERFGAVRNYVEPFCGSLAMLLARPATHFEGDTQPIETVNDLNAWLTNFWRAVQADPEAVAYYADWPVSELDLHARGDWLFYREGVDEWVEQLRSDPEFYDAKSAGWWCWGQCSWIGDGWGPRALPHGNRTRPELRNAGSGINAVERKRPVLAHAHMGIVRKRPHLANEGKGLERKRPSISAEAGILRPATWQPGPTRGIRGRGTRGLDGQPIKGRPRLSHQAGMLRSTVWRQRPHVGDGGAGINGCRLDRRRPVLSHGHGLRSGRASALFEYMQELCDRVRRVRIVCGDWQRVCGPAVTIENGLTGVFLDPPYGVGDRDTVYANDSRDVAARVLAWCREWGGHPKMRIALCGYEGEHDELEQLGWDVVAWKAHGGCGHNRQSGDYTNHKRERVWFSPGCVRPDGQLF